MDKEALLKAYRKVETGELWKIVGVVEDALLRWESRVQDEPSLRIRIRHGYDCLSIVQQAIEERHKTQESDLH